MGRADILAGLCLTLAATLLVHATAAGAWPSRAAFATCVAATVAASLFKETGITFVALLAGWPLAALALGGSPALASRSVTAAILTFLAYLAVRASLMGGVGLLLLRELENPISVRRGLPAFLSAAQVHAVYARLLTFPTSLSFDYSFNCIPIVESLGDPRNAAPALLYTLVVSAVGWSVRRLRTTRDDEAALVTLASLSWAAATFAPASHLLLPVGTMVAERLLYIPSIGAATLAGYAVWRLGAWSPRTATATLALLAALWLPTLVQGNIMWSSQTAFIEAGLARCPTSAKVLSNAGLHYNSLGRPEDAIAAFVDGRRIYPKLCEADHGIGLALFSLFQQSGKADLLTASLDKLHEGVQCVWTTQKAVSSLRLIYQTLSSSATTASQSLALRGWARLAEQLGNWEVAGPTWIDYGILLSGQGEHEDALAALDRGRLLASPDQAASQPNACLWYATSAGALGRLEEAAANAALAARLTLPGTEAHKVALGMLADVPAAVRVGARTALRLLVRSEQEAKEVEAFL